MVELADTPDLGSGAATRGGSSPSTRKIQEFYVILILKCGNSSVGRALPCQGRCRGFESRFPLFFFVLGDFDGNSIKEIC